MTLVPMSPATCLFNRIEYGNYIFSGFTTSNAKIDIIMSEDTYVSKYMKLQLEVTLILSNETVTRASGACTIAGIDAEMDAIRSELSKQRRSLKLSYRGLGESSLDMDELSSSSDIIEVPDELTGLVQGPFPKIISWEPLAGNQAAKVRWQVDAIYPICPNSGMSQIERLGIVPTTFRVGEEDFKYYDILSSFVEEQETEIDDEGALTLSTIGVIELMGNPGVVGFGDDIKKQDAANTLWHSVTREFHRHLMKLFETGIPTGFQRKHRIRYNKDSRRINYVITDTEVKSDNTLFPYILKCDVSHEVESNLLGKNFLTGMGFRTWGNTFQGSYTVRAGEWKGWAWIAFMIALDQRRERVRPYTGKPQEFLKNEKTQTAVDNAADKLEEGKQLTYYIKIKEEIYSRRVHFTVKYMSTSSLTQLFDNTGLFFPVQNAWASYTFDDDGKPIEARVPGEAVRIPNISNLIKVPDDFRTRPGLSSVEQWEWWREFAKRYQNVFGYRDVSLPDVTLLFDPCTAGTGGDTTNTVDLAGRSGFGPAVHTGRGPTTPLTAQEFAETRKLPNYIGRGNIKNVSVPVETPRSPGESGGRGFSSSGGDSPVDDISYYFNNMKKSQSYVNYDNHFEIIEESNSIHLPTLASFNISDRNNTSLNNSKKSEAGFQINGERGSSGTANGSDYSSHAFQVFSQPTYTVRMRGSAIRAGWSIPTPVLIGSTNLSTELGPSNLIKAYRVGRPRWSHKQIAQSVDIPIYMAMWDITYALKGNPSSANIGFNANNAAEFA